MKTYVRIVDGKVDNIFETNNPITEEFPTDQVRVDVTALPKIDYSWNAVNTNGVWTFSDSDPWGQPSWLSQQRRSERGPRLDKANATLASTALQYKVELGLATAADEASCQSSSMPATQFRSQQCPPPPAPAAWIMEPYAPDLTRRMLNELSPSPMPATAD